MPKRKFASGTYDSYFHKKIRRNAPVRRRLMARRRKIPRGMTLRSHSFHRWVTGMPSGFVQVTGCTYDPTTSVITCTAGLQTAEYSLSFPFSALPNTGEFTQLFDQYKITRVVFQIKMINNPDSVQVANAAGEGINDTNIQNANIYPTIWYTTDQDDGNTVSLAQIKEFERVRHRVLYPNRELTVSLRPTTLTQVYRTSLTTGYKTNNRSVWLDAAQTDIPHYGLKTVIDFEGVTTVPVYTFKVNVKYYFQCKSAR